MNTILRLLLTSLVGVCLLESAFAQTYTWTGTVSTNWNTAGNWDQGSVPVAGSSVVINACRSCPQLTANASIGNIYFNTGGGLNLQSFTLSVSADTQLYYATVHSSGGTIQSGHFTHMTYCNFNGAIRLEKTGGQKIFAHGGNKFYGPTIIASSGSADMFNLGMGEGDTFYEEITVNHNGGTTIGLGAAHSTVPTTFKKKLVVNITSWNLWGVELGNVRCEGPVEVNITGEYWGLTVGKGEFLQSVTIRQLSNGNTQAWYGCPVYIGWGQGKEVIFHNAVTVISTSALPGRDVYFGNNGSLCRFLAGASLSIGTEGFKRNSLVLQNCTFLSPNPTVLNLSAGTAPGPSTAKLYLDWGTSFTGPVQVTAPNLSLNGTVYNQDVTITKTGAGVDNCAGANTFKKKLTVINNADASSPINLATQYDDLIGQ